MFYVSDLITQYVPWYYLVSLQLKSFSFPHWVPDIYGTGYPLLAQGETGVLSPINFLILFFLPFPLSVGFLYIAYTTIAVSGAYFFLRVHKIDNLSSIFGAITFILSGFFISRYFQPSIIFTAAFVPWGLLILKKSFVDKKLLLLLSLLIYLQITAGHLQITFISITAYVSYALLSIIFYKKRLIKLIKLLIVISLGIILSSVQLLPSAKLFQLSERRNWDPNMRFSYSLPPSHLITYLVPNAFGVSKPGDDLGFTQFGGGFWEINITIWTLPFILSLIPAFFIIFKKITNQKLVKIIIIFYLIWAVLTLLSFGGFLKPNLIFAKIPNFPFRAPARFMLVSTFFASVLAAVGFSQISTLITKRLFFLLFMLIILISLLQINRQLKDYFIFKNQDFITSDIKHNIRSNNLWTPLPLDKSLINNYSSKQLGEIFKTEFYKGAVLSFISLAILVILWKKTPGARV